MKIPEGTIPYLAELRDQYSSEGDVADALDAAISCVHQHPSLVEALRQIDALIPDWIPANANVKDGKIREIVRSALSKAAAYS